MKKKNKICEVCGKTFFTRKNRIVCKECWIEILNKTINDETEQQVVREVLTKRLNQIQKWYFIF